MKKKLFLVFSSLLVIIFLFGNITGSVLGDSRKADAQDNRQDNRQITPGQGRLTACQAKEASIKNRMMHLTTLATNMQTKFDAIATRVENYYTNTVLPSGRTVTNYNALVIAIATQKTNVTSALTKAQTDANAFSCASGTTPKDQAELFRQDMQAVKGALKDFRTSIRNLIVAVHSVNGVQTTLSPKPTQ